MSCYNHNHKCIHATWNVKNALECIIIIIIIIIIIV